VEVRVNLIGHSNNAAKNVNILVMCFLITVSVACF